MNRIIDKLCELINVALSAVVWALMLIARRRGDK
jgi:hypothetical protein